MTSEKELFVSYERCSSVKFVFKQLLEDFIEIPDSNQNLSNVVVRLLESTYVNLYVLVGCEDVNGEPILVAHHVEIFSSYMILDLKHWPCESCSFQCGITNN